MNTSSPDSHECPRYPRVSSFMFCLQAELHSLFRMIFPSPSLGTCILSSPFQTSLCVSVCVHVESLSAGMCPLHTCFLIMCFFNCLLLVCSCHSSTLCFWKKRKMQDFSCFPVEALTPPPPPPPVSCLSSLHLSICIVMLPEWIHFLFFLILPWKKKGTISSSFPFSQMFLMLLVVFAVVLQFLIFSFD